MDVFLDLAFLELEGVKGHRYYRRSKRVGGRVVTEHVGRGELANLDARYDAESRELARRERLALCVEGQTIAAEFAPIFALAGC